MEHLKFEIKDGWLWIEDRSSGFEDFLMPHQHLIPIIWFIHCRKSRYFEDIVKLRIFSLRTTFPGPKHSPSLNSRGRPYWKTPIFFRPFPLYEPFPPLLSLPSWITGLQLIAKYHFVQNREYCTEMQRSAHE